MKRLVALLLAGVAVYAIVATAHPGATGIGFDVLVLYLGAILLARLVGHIRGIAPPAERSVIEAALARERAGRERLAELERVERKVVLGVANAGDLHAGLQPLLRDIAAPLLAVHGVDLERDPDGVRQLVGDDAWELLRADLPRPEFPFDPGVPERRLTGAVAALEGLAP